MAFFPFKLRLKRVTGSRLAVGLAIFTPMLALLLALRVGLVQNFMVSSGSMEPTLYAGDRVFMKRIGKEGFGRGDVVVLVSPLQTRRMMTKRVIGVPGDEITVKNGFLYLNGRDLAEWYVSRQNLCIKSLDKHYTVPPDRIFVLGDNRNFSFDSLNTGFGTIPISDVKGQLKIIYWPLRRFGLIDSDFPIEEP